uniref:Uncharacterized protein n=1 Tax=Arundo donax TaxID=35708 RepID=A0A0A8YH10_ARUDO
MKRCKCTVFDKYVRCTMRNCKCRRRPDQTRHLNHSWVSLKLTNCQTAYRSITVRLSDFSWDDIANSERFILEIFE